MNELCNLAIEWLMMMGALLGVVWCVLFVMVVIHCLKGSECETSIPNGTDD